VHAIETVGLTKYYGHHTGGAGSLLDRLRGSTTPPVRALESLDIAVREGEIFGFLGPNGSGKSTTIRLLLGFLHPTAGRGRVLGLDTVQDSVAIRRRLGYLPSGIALYDTLTGEQVLDYLGKLSGRPSSRKTGSVLTVLNVFGSMNFRMWVPNFDIQELMPHSPLTNEVFPHNYRYEDGYLVIDDVPGLGVDINEELAAKYPYERAYLPVARLADGAMWNW